MMFKFALPKLFKTANSERAGWMLQLAALLAWAMVAYLVVESLWQQHASLAVLLASGVALLVYLLAMRQVTSGRAHLQRRWAPYWLALQYVAVFCLLWLVSTNVVSILLVIVVAQLPALVSCRTAIVMTIAWLLLHMAVRHWYWQLPNVVLETLLDASFQVFAYFAMMSAHTEQQAREQLQQVNNELQATQALLAEATRQHERLQVARHLHDVLGHHLTALSIQLEIAGHCSEGKAQAQVHKAQHLATLLLSDVRAAVSEMRDEAVFDLRTALQALVQNVPRLTVHLALPDQRLDGDMAQAQTLLRLVQEAITNTLRHAQAQQIWISLSHEDGQWTVAIHDDGRVNAPLREGNGLRGMRERLRQHGGNLQLGLTAQQALQLRAQLGVAHD